MSNAFEITVEDVESVLRSNSLAVANTNGKSFESIANEVFGNLDFVLIEKAALYGDDLDGQTDYANDEIARQLREMGILEPLKEVAMEAHGIPQPLASRESAESKARKIAEITVHDFHGVSHHEVYDRTQTDDSIKDGDVLNLGNGNVAILISAWPTVVLGEIQEFHQLESGVTFESIDDGKYAASAEKARQVSNCIDQPVSEKTRNLVVDGFDKSACFAGDGVCPPFVVFDVDRQENIAGPFASRNLADQHRLEILAGLPPHLDTAALCSALDLAENGDEQHNLEQPQG